MLQLKLNSRMDPRWFCEEGGGEGFALVWLDFGDFLLPQYDFF